LIAYASANRASAARQPAGSPVADVRISSSMVVAGCQQELLSY
jgi:hypothetical protein